VNHASNPPLSFLQAGCPSCHPTNSVEALKANDAARLTVWKLRNWQKIDGIWQHLNSELNSFTNLFVHV